MNDQTKPGTGFAIALVIGGCAVCLALALGFQPVRPPDAGVTTQRVELIAKPALLLVDSSIEPKVMLRWQTREGWREERFSVGYTSPTLRTELATGVEAFVALGGTRLDKGAGDPNGAIVRVGFYRAEGAGLFLEGIAPGGWVEVELADVRFNQAVESSSRSIIQHVKYSAEALEACGAPSELGDVYATANAADDLNGDLMDERGVRAGFFSAAADDASWGRREMRVMPASSLGGYSSVVVRGGDRVRMRAAFPYSALRHVVAQGEPPVPGEFSEPDHFHIEFEAVPALRSSGRGSSSD